MEVEPSSVVVPKISLNIFFPISPRRGFSFPFGFFRGGSVGRCDISTTSKKK